MTFEVCYATPRGVVTPSLGSLGLEHRQSFMETNKQFAAARENRTPHDGDITRERNQAVGAAAIWLGKPGQCSGHCLILSAVLCHQQSCENCIGSYLIASNVVVFLKIACSPLWCCSFISFDILLFQQLYIYGRSNTDYSFMFLIFKMSCDYSC